MERSWERLGAIVIAFLAAVPASGCYDPDFGDGGTRCDDPPRLCPSDYECVPEAEASYCRPEGSRAPAIDQVTLQPVSTSAASPQPITVRIQLSNFKLESVTDVPNEAHFGHFHLYLTPGGKYTPFFTDPGTLDPRDPKYLLRGLGPGSHDLTAVLVHHSHTPLVPRVEKTVRLVLKP